ncbi:uncharacterized protein LAESUDRAFT_717223 [Laetiporus sulphureus 93-53]|uniref:Uncharacterized protein n=1 Tax=Laetiporus sulphureus 93-53 TaxID=1314785 RepID=A0A165BYM1_9APHY|nr:uncharacterized protein LAESUDRAFT_717223 [Laetiporus sulphureus 93-53]KZT01887.1 hypothetical protein LAESUDRAFT_717223 [Laetiporus sulphureus 93-53]
MPMSPEAIVHVMVMASNVALLNMHSAVLACSSHFKPKDIGPSVADAFLSSSAEILQAKVVEKKELSGKTPVQGKTQSTYLVAMAMKFDAECRVKHNTNAVQACQLSSANRILQWHVELIPKVLCSTFHTKKTEQDRV